MVENVCVNLGGVAITGRASPSAQPAAKTSTPDFVCENHGSVFLLRPISPAAFAWINEHLPADRQMFGNAVAVEHRFIWSILAGLQEDGLTVSR